MKLAIHKMLFNRQNKQKLKKINKHFSALMSIAVAITIPSIFFSDRSVICKLMISLEQYQP